MKPSNVLLADGDRVSVRLLDFGLARMAEAETLTAQGDVPGTLAYISPERLAGEDASEGSDVWAVGVMLWESLSGRHPFWQTSMLDTARAIEQGAESLATLRPDLPKALIQLVDRALSLSPARRPSAVELARALRGAAAPRRKPKARSVEPRACRSRQRAQAPQLSRAASPAGRAAELPVLSERAGRSCSRSSRLRSPRFARGSVSPLRSPCRCCRSGTSRSGSPCSTPLLAAAWIVLCWREPRGALLFALGPLLAPLAALGLVPLAASGLRAGPRRAAQAAVAVLAAGVVAGVRGAALPFTGARAAARTRRRRVDRPARRRRHAHAGRRPRIRRS